jgi:hypothetical protein
MGINISIPLLISGMSFDHSFLRQNFQIYHCRRAKTRVMPDSYFSVPPSSLFSKNFLCQQYLQGKPLMCKIGQIAGGNMESYYHK